MPLMTLHASASGNPSAGSNVLDQSSFVRPSPASVDSCYRIKSRARGIGRVSRAVQVVSREQMVGRHEVELDAIA